MKKNIIHSLKKFLISNRPTHPYIMGDKILLLGTAPDASKFFEEEVVRNQFKDYDLAFINYMIIYSEQQMFQYKPKYVILMDPIFYQDDYFGVNQINPEKQKVVRVLEKVNWECYLLTTTLAEFNIVNHNIKYIYLSCFSLPYNKMLLPILKTNWVNLGINNVMHGAIYFAITFGYKTIAILGCTYQLGVLSMEEDGLHILGYRHYYNYERTSRIISNEVIEKAKKSPISEFYERGKNSLICFWNLKKYASVFNAKIINYSEKSSIDAFLYGKLENESDCENIE